MTTTKKLVTTKFGVAAAQQFIDSFSRATDNYFLYFGKHVPYGVKFPWEESSVVGEFDASTDVTNNTISITGVTFNVGDRIRYFTDTGITPITGLTNNAIYYVFSSFAFGYTLTANATSTTPISMVPKSTSETHFFTYASGSSTVAPTTGDVVESPRDSEIYSSVEAYDDMIFAKRIMESDVRPMIDNYQWISGTTYAHYDNTDANLFLKKYFVVVDDSTEYNVFKCLDNNGSSPSTEPPVRNGNSLDYYPLETSDGYVWKYMFTISKFEYEKFATTAYAPVVANTEVIDNAVPGTIDVVKILNGGQGYSNWYKGSFQAADIKYQGAGTFYGLGDDASSIDNYYQDCVIKITGSQTPGIVGQYKVIRSSVGAVQPNGRKYVVLDSAFSATPSVGDTYEVYPLVYLWGDGAETIQASARAIINSTSSNSIHRIEMLNVGRAYRVAQATFAIPNVISSSVDFKEALLQPIVSPASGHGGDPYGELGARRVAISVTVSETENGTIPANNDFRSVGIIKNPKYQNVTITHGEGVGKFTIGEEVVQFKNIKLFGTMETIAGNNVIFKTGNGQISSTIILAANGTGYDHTVNDTLVFNNINTGGSGAEGTFTANITPVTSLSFGSSNSVVNSFIVVGSSQFANGDRVKYFTNSNSSGVTGLSNNDYYFVVSANSTAFRLSANNNETAFKSISNSDVVGSNVTIAIVNGAIKTVSVSNRGVGYNKVPQVTINEEAGGSGAVLVASIANPEATTFNDSLEKSDLILLTDGERNFVSNVAVVINNYQLAADVSAPFTTDIGQISKLEITARGTVSSVSTGQLTLTNVSGIFSPGKNIVGRSSYATSTINNDEIIMINDKNSKGFVTSVQLSTLVGTISPGFTPFVYDEKIYQDSVAPFNQPSGRIHSVTVNDGDNNDVVYITREYGVFNTDPNGARSIYSEVSESEFQLLNIYHGDFVRGSGDVLYIENLDPISRSGSKSEVIKAILEF